MSQIDLAVLETIRTQVDAYIDRRIHAIASGIASEVAGNQAPGGMHPIEMVVVSPSASTSVSVGSVPVPYKCYVDEVILACDEGSSAGTATVDIWRARSSDTMPTASLFSTDTPQMTGVGIIEHTAPTTNWVRDIEPDTVLFYRVTAVSGISRLDISLIVRALPW